LTSSRVWNRPADREEQPFSIIRNRHLKIHVDAIQGEICEVNLEDYLGGGPGLKSYPTSHVLDSAGSSEGAMKSEDGQPAMTEEIENREGLILLRAKFNEESEKWKAALAGQPNTPEVLTQKGHVMATLVVACAQHSYWSLTVVVGDLDKKLGKQPPTREQFVPMCYEWIWLYIHLIDRIAFKLIGPEKRSALIDALVEKTVEILRETAEEESPELKQLGNEAVKKAELEASFWEILSERQMEYAKYPKLYPEGNEGYGSTLLCEFGKKLAVVVGREHDPDFWYPIYAGVGHPMTIEVLRAAREILPE